MFWAQFSPRARAALDRGRDFFPLQRLDEIIIDPGVQNGLAINIIMPSGGDDHLGGRKFFPDRPAHLQTTELWQQEVTNDRFRLVLEGKFNPTPAFIRFEHVPTLAREQTRRPFTAFDVVVD